MNGRLNFLLLRGLSERTGMFPGIGQVVRTDASYCLDAPEVMPAGSMERLDVGSTQFPCETLCEREPA